LNCKAELQGRFCHVCGQENLEPKETVWHLVQHFFNDITHFDGKFFETVKFLLRKPGFLSTEYMLGRRATYLNPIRMYVFTSAIFFIILFTLRKPEDMLGEGKKDKHTTEGLPSLIQRQAILQKSIPVITDEDDVYEARERLRDLSVEIAKIKALYGDSTQKTFSKAELNDFLLRAYSDSLQNTGLSQKDRNRLSDIVLKLNRPESDRLSFGVFEGRFRSVEEYDSSEQKTPDSLRDGWLARFVKHRTIIAREEYREDPRRFKERLMENIFHSFPKILFWSLPIFAMILNILYFRHKKTYYYVDHGIFTIHVYCATFILLLIAMLLGELSNALQWRWLQVIDIILIVAVIFYMFIYLYKAMRGFYKQGRAKTFIKYAIVCWIATFVNGILLAIFLAISAFSA
jgi:hypothetical protein